MQKISTILISILLSGCAVTAYQAPKDQPSATLIIESSTLRKNTMLANEAVVVFFTGSPTATSFNELKQNIQLDPGMNSISNQIPSGKIWYFDASIIIPVMGGSKTCRSKLSFAPETDAIYKVIANHDISDLECEFKWYKQDNKTKEFISFKTDNSSTLANIVKIEPAIIYKKK